MDLASGFRRFGGQVPEKNSIMRTVIVAAISARLLQTCDIFMTRQGKPVDMLIS
jgi:hypothetical protein